MPSNTEDREHAQKVIRALLLTKKEGYTLSELLWEYQEVEGTPLPWQSFGFMSPLDFIRSMPSTVQVRRSNGTIMLKGIASDKTKHISTLVAEQKVECKKKGRKMFKPSHFFPNTAPARVHTPAGILTKLVKLLKEYPDGISKDYALQYIQSYMPSINITMQDMEDQLLSMSHKLIVLNNRICLVQNQTEPASDSCQASKCQFTNLGSSESQNEIKTQPINHSADREVPLPSLMDLELSHPLSDSLSNANFDGMSIKTIDTTIINDRTKFRLEKLIQKEPDGIWCAELPEKYLDAYKVSLNYMDFGFSSVRDFASQLTEIFRVEQPEGGGDFKLYDAKAEKPPVADKDPSKCWEQNNIYDIFNVLNLPEALPSIISSDIVKEIIPEDVMTIGECVGHILVESLTQRDQLYVEVNVVEVFTPTFFWVQLRKAEKLFDEFMNDLHNFYTANQKQYRVPSIVLETGLNCACKYDGRWHRGIIKTVKPDLQVTVMFYDYGTLKTCPAEEIHYLHRTFSHLPAQAIPCGLVNTKPKSGEKWSRRVTHEFALRTSGIPLVATIASYNKTDNSMMVTLTDTLEEDDVHINDWMVEQNFALHGKMVCMQSRNFAFHYYLMRQRCLKSLPNSRGSSIVDQSVDASDCSIPRKQGTVALYDSSTNVYNAVRASGTTSHNVKRTENIRDKKLERNDPTHRSDNSPTNATDSTNPTDSSEKLLSCLQLIKSMTLSNNDSRKSDSSVTEPVDKATLKNPNDPCNIKQTQRRTVRERNSEQGSQDSDRINKIPPATFDSLIVAPYLDFGTDLDGVSAHDIKQTRAGDNGNKIECIDWAEVHGNVKRVSDPATINPVEVKPAESSREEKQIPRAESVYLRTVQMCKGAALNEEDTQWSVRGNIVRNPETAESVLKQIKPRNDINNDDTLITIPRSILDKLREDGISSPRDDSVRCQLDNIHKAVCVREASAETRESSAIERSEDSLTRGADVGNVDDKENGNVRSNAVPRTRSVSTQTNFEDSAEADSPALIKKSEVFSGEGNECPRCKSLELMNLKQFKCFSKVLNASENGTDLDSDDLSEPNCEDENDSATRECDNESNIKSPVEIRLSSPTTINNALNNNTDNIKQRSIEEVDDRLISSDRASSENTVFESESQINEERENPSEVDPEICPDRSSVCSRISLTNSINQVEAYSNERLLSETTKEITSSDGSDDIPVFNDLDVESNCSEWTVVGVESFLANHIFAAREPSFGNSSGVDITEITDFSGHSFSVH